MKVIQEDAEKITLYKKSAIRTNENLHNEKPNQIFYEKGYILGKRLAHLIHELIWGGDHDTEDNEMYEIVHTQLRCPEYTVIQQRMFGDPSGNLH